MGRIEDGQPRRVQTTENNAVNNNQNGNNQPQVNNNANNNVAPGGAPENLRNQGDYTRFQLETRFTAQTGNGDAGRTPKAEEALGTVRSSLDESGLFNDVTHDDLKKIEDTLRGLNRDELNHVLTQMTPEEFSKWGGELNSGGWFGTGGFDENQQSALFNHLAQNASADNLVKMFEGLGTNVDSVMSLMDSVSQSAPPAVRDAFIQRVSNHPNMEAVRNEMLLDLGQMGLDIAGIFDPTGVVDGANAVGYLLRGKIGDAIMTGAGIVPLLGDLAKAGKLGKFAARLSNIIELAKHSPQFARAAETALKSINDVLKNIPLDSLPKPIRDFVESTRQKIDDFLTPRAAQNLTDDLASAGYRSSDATRADFREMFVNTFGQARYDSYVRAAEDFKAANPSLAHIPTEDLVALRGYTDDVVNPATGLRDYQAMNNALRSGDPAQLAQFDSYIRCATSALNQMPPSAGTVFRGTNLPPSVVNNYTPGQVVTERAFTSTSNDAAQAFPGDTQFVVNSTNGRRVDGISAIPSESEVLFPPGTQFEVLDVRVDPTTNVRTIFMTEVPR